jgi:hypothetical protein
MGSDERDDPRDENDGEELEGEFMRTDHGFKVDLCGTTPRGAGTVGRGDQSTR